MNVVARHHHRAVYSSQALRHVAEQIDALYWAGADPARPAAGQEVFEKDVDLTEDVNIAKLPQQWPHDEGMGDADLER